MIKLKVVYNEIDRRVVEIFAEDIFIAKILKSFYIKKKPFPETFQSIEQARSWFLEFEKNADCGCGPFSVISDCNAEHVSRRKE